MLGMASPARHDELTALRAVADDRRPVVREDPREWRQITGAIAQHLGQGADGLLALSHGIEIAHSPSLDRPARRENPAL